MAKNPLVSALLASLYIVLVASFVRYPSVVYTFRYTQRVSANKGKHHDYSQTSPPHAPATARSVAQVS